ncbi:molecular chaperone DnaJ [Pseudohoeflea suaedae]|uniref:Molecular chaperone DnaJ n=1 Tax=Pseudohoeflea suaedae TaxID=877384 RepID=A0A4R5PLL1_9HYPH|nr:molecular chaperone DnaJ [Pseudohoeflea suaedae]
MARLVLIILLLAGASILIAMVVRMKPEKVAHSMRFGGAGLAALLGVLLLVTGKAFLGMPLLAGAAALLRHAFAKLATSRKPGQKSRVYSDALMMELDLDSGDMNGLVLKGEMNGAELNQLDEASLLKLHAELAEWTESRDLLETYLDRRISDWRDRVDPQAGAGLGRAQSSGTMTEEEAYEILGLAPGAGEADIRKAHRSLMKRVHPDTGGSAALAARLNEAKDLLLRRHV